MYFESGCKDLGEFWYGTDLPATVQLSRALLSATLQRAALISQFWIGGERKGLDVNVECPAGACP